MKSNVRPMPEIAAVLLGAGFTPWRAVVTLAVIRAESGCDAWAVGLNDHDPTSPAYLSLDLGLCQWNSHWYAMPTRDAFTPEVAIAKMFVVSKGGFLLTPWHAFTAGAHLQYMSAARSAVSAAGGRV